MTNTELPSEKVVNSYEKRSNAENYIEEAKYDMAVRHFLLKPFGANNAIFQLMILAYAAYNLFCYSRWILQGKPNTGSKLKRLCLSTFSWLGRSLER